MSVDSEKLEEVESITFTAENIIIGLDENGEPHCAMTAEELVALQQGER